jgi:hypothetical protein
MRVERDALYADVWNRPLRTIARDYGISDVALKKHCRKLNIPTPGLGYWAKKEAGHTMRRIPLPRAKSDTPTFTNIAVGNRTEPKPAPTEGPVWEQSQYEADPKNKIVVADDLEGAPRSVRHTRAALRQAKSDECGIVRPFGAGCLDVAVTRESVDRALRIFHAFLTACDARDFAITLSQDGKPGCTVTVRNERVAIRIEERTRREERKATNPPRGPHEYAPRPYPRYEFFPTGRLLFRIAEQYLYDVRCSWADGTRQRVEDCLNDVMVALVAAAEAKRQAREAAEERQRRWAEEEQQRAERARVRELEERRYKQLLQDFDAWELATRLRAFAVAAEQRGDVTAAGLEDLKLWVDWVRRHAAAKDPLDVENVGAHLTREPPPSWAFPSDRQGFR